MKICCSTYSPSFGQAHPNSARSTVLTPSPFEIQLDQEMETVTHRQRSKQNSSDHVSEEETEQPAFSSVTIDPVANVR